MGYEIPREAADLIVVVLEPLTALDYINNALNTYGTAVKEFFTLMTVIGRAGISGWILNKIRHKRKRRCIKHRKYKTGYITEYYTTLITNLLNFHTDMSSAGGGLQLF